MEERVDDKGARGNLGQEDGNDLYFVFYILIVVVITRLYSIVKTHRTVMPKQGGFYCM